MLLGLVGCYVVGFILGVKFEVGFEGWGVVYRWLRVRRVFRVGIFNLLFFRIYRVYVVFVGLVSLRYFLVF